MASEEVWTVLYEDQIDGTDGIASVTGPRMSEIDARKIVLPPGPYETDDGRLWRKAEPIKIPMQTA